MTSSRPSEIVLFAGPSLRGISSDSAVALARVDLRPPVARDDIAALLANPPRAIAIADGLFLENLAVSHREIRDALEADVPVWGLSSMGAIRAYEMRHLGMLGFGEVYSRFDCDGDFQDDEVALLHGPPPDYAAQSEPLVHMRVALETMRAEELLSASACEEIAGRMKSMWFGDRTLPQFLQMAASAASDSRRSQLLAALAPFDRFRIKNRDLDRFLLERPWAA